MQVHIYKEITTRSHGERTQKSPDKSRPFAPGADSIEKRKSATAEQKTERFRVLEKKVYAFSLRNVQSKKFVFDLFVVRKDGSEMTEMESSDKENLKRQKNKIERNVFNIGDEMKTCNKHSTGKVQSVQWKQRLSDRSGSFPSERFLLSAL
ncbi:hypothetical protein RUM43_008751 [Polyplax serrata]|uniref:Uncharacterized protein n=1 Tax=Polyplax serrata TaxID=468196 RepID=A0AAN8NN65_POLSC